MGRKLTNIEFINKAVKIHGDKYDYSKTEYIKSSLKVTIICKIHGDFLQNPSLHISQKKECPKCVGNFKKTTSEFIQIAYKVYGDRYDYSKVDYINTDSKIIIICKIHGEFLQTPHLHINRLCGCKKCSNIKQSKRQAKSIDKFIYESNKIHKNKYDYSQVIYKNNRTKIYIICNIHGIFSQIPDNHLKGFGCSKCTGKNKKTTDEIKILFINKHKDKYDYSKVEYKTTDTKVNIICKTHGEFLQTPYYHLKGQNCPKCVNFQFSNKQIQWLEFLEKYYNISIQHALNDGEYKIKNTKWKADGYCKENNTIYEFHGDYWHGNPKCYLETDKNTISNKTMGYLYKKTLEREQKIKDLGYNLVVMWESDWNKINKSVKKLQKQFRKS